MPSAAEPDEQLMLQVCTGRREAVSVLLRRYASRLLTFIERMVGDRHRGEELFQEVFPAVWRGEIVKRITHGGRVVQRKPGGSLAQGPQRCVAWRSP